MPIMNLRNCPKHNRLLMQFNYPKSCKPKEVLVIPNITDNLISMNSSNDKNTRTWLANKSLMLQNKPSVSSFLQMTPRSTEDKTVTRIFQYSPERSLLQEFNLVGILIKQSNFAHEFEGKQVLAMGSQKLRFLVTEEKNSYLEKIEIKEIEENHECTTKSTIDTTKIYLTIGTEKITLFDLMYECKNRLKCSFRWQFNQKMEIMLTFILQSGYMFTGFIINHVGSD